ncbi:MAG: DUF1553 domain-containing protein [Planctomycetaceae bacterium]
MTARPSRHRRALTPVEPPARIDRPGWLRAALAVVIVAAATADGAASEPERFFEEKVRPLLANRCQGCHGERVAENGLRLDHRPGLLRGGSGGPVIVPGDAGASRILAVVRRTAEPAMPPDEPLAPDEVAILETWIAAGAPWSGPGAAGPPEAPAAAGDAVPADMAARLAWARERHWAFRPIERHAPPPLPAGLAPDRAGAWTGTIDRFLAAAIVAAGQQPAAQAAPRELVRRLWFDVVGLPPPADRVDAFAADPSEAAWTALVDELLASPAHAEHWARHWLDLARYADTMGYALDRQDPRYPFAWTYRDWVVRALEADLPYDRFVTLQLAADLVDPPADSADLAALGFLTVGRTFIGNRHDIIDDRIDLVSRGLLGLTVACGRCHDHKYEPVSAADYYGLYGIFASANIPDDLPVIGTAPPGPEAEAFAARQAELLAAIPAHEDAVRRRGTRAAIAHAADYLLEVARPTPRKADGRPPRLADDYDMVQFVIDRVRGLVASAPPTDPVLGPWVALAAKPDAEIGPAMAAMLAVWGDAPDAALVHPLVAAELRSPLPADLRGVAEAYARLLARVAPEWAGGPPVAADEGTDVAALRARLVAGGTGFVVAPAEAMLLATIEEGNERRRLLMEVTRHEADSPGAPPKAMVLRDDTTPTEAHVFVRGNPGRRGDQVGRRLPELLGGTPAATGASGRLELARGIVDPANPLAARLVVNWVWAHHFGRGIADPVGDLGLRGPLPSHPELLDDLARRFIDEGKWSLRWLHREILASRAWRQSATVAAEAVAADPDNRLVARFERRRIGWEAWRDASLTAGGLLDGGKRGGRGIDPLARDAMDRRTLYTRLDRQDVPGILRVFDVANPDAATHQRSLTSVPQQSLAALNAPLVVEAARAAAARAGREAGADDDRRIRALWRACLSRSPDDEELAHARAFLGAAGGPGDFGPWEQLAQALLASAEFQFVD